MKTRILKVFCVFAMLTIVVSVNAQQKGDMAVGIDLVGGTSDFYSNYGVGAKFQYSITDHIRLEPSFIYFLKKNDIYMWDLSANVHYLFPVNDKIVLYPLAGIGMLGLGGNRFSGSEVAFNMGGGAQYLINEKLSANFEIKYVIRNDWNRTLVSAGVAYKF